jgi:hypothetical protein
MEPMLFRRNAGLERLEWSGCKADESGRCPASQFVRGRNSADTCPERFRGSVGSVKPGCCLFLTRSEATRFQCLTPRLKSSANLNGWNARMTFKDMKPSNARAV